MVPARLVPDSSHGPGAPAVDTPLVATAPAHNSRPLSPLPRAFFLLLDRVCCFAAACPPPAGVADAVERYEAASEAWAMMGGPEVRRRPHHAAAARARGASRGGACPLHELCSARAPPPHRLLTTDGAPLPCKLCNKQFSVVVAARGLFVAAFPAASCAPAPSCPAHPSPPQPQPTPALRSPHVLPPGHGRLQQHAAAHRHDPCLAAPTGSSSSLPPRLLPSPHPTLLTRTSAHPGRTVALVPSLEMPLTATTCRPPRRRASAPSPTS